MLGTSCKQIYLEHTVEMWYYVVSSQLAGITAVVCLQPVVLAISKQIWPLCFENGLVGSSDCSKLLIRMMQMHSESFRVLYQGVTPS